MTFHKVIIMCVFVVQFVGVNLVFVEDVFSSNVNLVNFQTVFEWSYINFTWNSYTQYRKAVQRRLYIPQNIMPGGIKFYRERLYIALPKFRNGVPVTLASLPKSTPRITNNLLIPYPHWNGNDDSICSNLQSILNMEIDPNGIMYAVDGVRMNNNNVQCPCKIVLLDLNNHGKQIQTLILSSDLCLPDGGFLNDIVVDQSDGDFAYITDTSNIDPGILVFSRYQNRAWKIRDKTMFSQPNVRNFEIDGDRFSQLTPVDGIALSPKLKQRMLFFCALMAYNLYGINTDVLKNERLCRSDSWRNMIHYIGRKQSQTDGMMMDSKGNLYYSLVPLYGLGRWNIFENFDASEVIYENRQTFIWTDGFGMDQHGFIYLITNWAYRYFETNYTLEFTEDIRFRIHRLYVGSRSYLFNDLRHEEIF